MSRHSRFRTIIRDQLWQAKRGLIAALIAMFFMTAIDLLRPWPLKIIFDYILLDHDVPIGLAFAQPLIEGKKRAAIFVFAGAMVLLAVVRGALAYVESYQTARLGNQVAYRLRVALFSHLQRLSLTFHSQSRTGELMNKVAGDTAAVKAFFSDSLLTLGSHALTVIGVFIVMFLMNWRMSIVVLLSFPLLALNLASLYGRARKSARQQRKKEDHISSRISETLNSVQLVQAFGREQYEQRRFESEVGEHLEESLNNAKIESCAARTVEVTTAAGTCAVVLYGSLQVLDGAMSLGSILVFSSYLHGLYRPIRNLVKLTIRLSKLRVSVHRMSEVLATAPDIRDRPNAISAAGLCGRISFEEVSFAYAATSRKALENVTFQIEPGSTVAIIGASGAGKSTLIGLILRLYDPTHGRISIDGVDLKDYQVESLRSQMSIVLQDSVLLGSTVYENIGYGRLNATRAEIEDAAKIAQAHEFIVALDQGYHTVVGERGARLSGGQQRRIALARAIVRQAPIMILDEPMTGLDRGSETRVDRELSRLVKDRTCLLITHDLRAAATADAVIVLEKGRVQAIGKPQQVLRTYRRGLLTDENATHANGPSQKIQGSSYDEEVNPTKLVRWEA